MLESAHPLREEQITLDEVYERLGWMQQNGIWPNGSRDLWTDAFGVVLLISLYRYTGERSFLGTAEWVVEEVERVLGRPRGVRTGEAREGRGQDYHSLMKWVFALERLGRIKPHYKARAVDLVQEIHPAFVAPGQGVWRKMQEDLSGPYPGSDSGVLEAFHGYVVCRLVDEAALAPEIEDLHQLVERAYPGLSLTQDVALGMMLWLTHVFPDEDWALAQRERCLETLRTMWIEPPGYFCRTPERVHAKLAFANYGVSLGLQAVGAMEECVPRLERFFRTVGAADEYAGEAVTHVMACTSLFPGEFLIEHAHGATPTGRLLRT